MGVFIMVLFRGYANIMVDIRDVPVVSNNLLYGLLIIIFTVSAKNVSQALFNPSFAITQNLFGKLSTGATVGYLCSHIVAALCATAVLSNVLQYEGNFDRPTLYLGVKSINDKVYFFSVLTQEIIGSMFLYFGYLHYFVHQKDTYEKGCLFYGFLVSALSMATYSFNGGAYNLAIMLGGIIFDNALDKKLVFMFFGNIIGTIIAKLLYQRVIGRTKEQTENKVLKMLFSTN